MNTNKHSQNQKTKKQKRDFELIQSDTVFIITKEELKVEGVSKKIENLFVNYPDYTLYINEDLDYSTKTNYIKITTMYNIKCEFIIQKEKDNYIALILSKNVIKNK